jgi:hypothetical protein
MSAKRGKSKRQRQARQRAQARAQSTVAAAPTQAPAPPARARSRERPAPEPKREPAAREAPPISRTDGYWAGGVAALSAILFATAITGHPALGDAPESIAGVDSLGILHAPGYPAYVIAAWIFTTLIPFGSFAFQVNLFSLVCASLSVAGVYLLARRCGAVRWASALGALALAAGAAFWFYATFAKHDMFSGLLFLAAVHLLLSWQERPTRGKLVGLAAVMAVGLGSSWPLQLLLAPAIGFVLIRDRRQLHLPSLLQAAAAGLLVVVSLYGFVLVRAGQHPAVNWGEATNIGRLGSLVNRSDFQYHVKANPTSETGRPGTPSGSRPRINTQSKPELTTRSSARLGRVATATGVEAQIFTHELGISAIILAAWGLFVAFSRRRRDRVFYPLLLVFVGDFLGAVLVTGASGYNGFDTNLVHEGFVLGCYFVLAAWLAVGATDLVATAGETDWPRDPRTRRALGTWVLPAALGLLVLVPSVAGHWGVGHRAADPLADRYAKTVFDTLPPRAVVFIWGAERAQPMIYRQVVKDERPDVVVVASDLLTKDWYPEQISREIGRPLPPQLNDTVADTRRAIEAVRGFRPVYMDMPTAQALQASVGYRPVGLLARVTGGTGVVALRHPELLAQKMRDVERAAGMPDSDWGLWPNYFVRDSYLAAAYEVFWAYIGRSDLAGARRALRGMLRVDPGNPDISSQLQLLKGAKSTPLGSKGG